MYHNDTYVDRLCLVVGVHNRYCTVRLRWEDYIPEHDVVITTYDTLRRESSMFRRFHWHRIVLDECQEIKVATNVVYL